LKKLTETEKRILLWMLTDLSMVLILCGKLLRKWASEFEWGMWRNIEWGIGIGVTVVGVLGIAAALYLVWKFRKNTGNSKMTAFAGSESEKAGKTAKARVSLGIRGLLYMPGPGQARPDKSMKQI